MMVDRWLFALILYSNKNTKKKRCQTRIIVRLLSVFACGSVRVFNRLRVCVCVFFCERAYYQLKLIYGLERRAENRKKININERCYFYVLIIILFSSHTHTPYMRAFIENNFVCPPQTC